MFSCAILIHCWRIILATLLLWVVFFFQQFKTVLHLFYLVIQVCIVNQVRCGEQTTDKQYYTKLQCWGRHGKNARQRNGGFLFFLLAKAVQENVWKHPRAQKCFPDKFRKIWTFTWAKNREKRSTYRGKNVDLNQQKKDFKVTLNYSFIDCQIDNSTQRSYWLKTNLDVFRICCLNLN